MLSVGYIPFKWDLVSLILYIILGLLAVYMLYNSRQKNNHTNRQWLFKDKYLTTWFLIWLIFAVFRLVNHPIGGMDAPNYIQYFQICRNNYIPEYFEHFAGDVLFKYFNQLIRLITSDYHIYFFAVYGLMCYAFISFCREFCPSKTNLIPYILTFFLYLRGFSSVRSHLSIVVIIFACLLLIRGKIRLAIIVALLSMFVHKAALLYALVIPFCLIFSQKGISLKMFLLLMITSTLLASVFRQYFILFTADMDMSGAYTSYAMRSTGTSFLDNAWKIAFEQLLLGLFMILYNKRLKEYINRLNDKERAKVNIIYLICIFDLLLIPINYMLSIWRGYEYFYLARLVMWGIILYIATKKTPRKLTSIYSFIFLICFTSWMIFRIWSTWESSGLMPYVFEPFLYL